MKDAGFFQLVFDNPAQTLIYESYLHVALTREKEKIYFSIEKNNDEIP